MDAGTTTNWFPIRKLIAVFVGSGLALIAKTAGVDLGPELLNESAVVVAGLLLGYVVKDPQVAT